MPPEPPEGDFVYPWGVELDGGERCIVLTGAHSTIGEDIVDYECDDGLYLLRGIDQAAPLWRVRSARRVDGDYRIDERTIRIAWY